MKMVKFNVLITGLIIFLMHLSFCLGQERQITTDPGYEVNAAISGDRIVWHTIDFYDPENVNIYFVDLRSSGVTGTHIGDCFYCIGLEISGDTIVWSETDPSTMDEDLHLYDIVQEEETRIYRPKYQVYPKISENRIVWSDNRNDNGLNGNLDIYLYDIITGIETIVTTDPGPQWSPSISGDRIVYTDQRQSANNEIYLYNIATGIEERITNDPDIQQDADISGDKIVWWLDDYENNNGDIYLYDITTRETIQLTDDPYHQVNPKISGNWVVWEEFGNPGSKIYLYDITTGITRKITDYPSNQASPSISGNRIVWHDDRNGNADVYLYDLVCEGDFNSDGDCDGSDAFLLKTDFGRGILNPCESGNTCHGDFDCDGDVDGTDAFTFKADFGRSLITIPCAACEVGEWCQY